LGLKLIAKENGKHLFFRRVNQMFLIFRAEETIKQKRVIPPHSSTGSGHVAFAMSSDEIESWRNYFKSKTNEIESEVTWPIGGRSLYLRDQVKIALNLRHHKRGSLMSEPETT
jgi:hypothetical protein